MGYKSIDHRNLLSKFLFFPITWLYFPLRKHATLIDNNYKPVSMGRDSRMKGAGMLVVSLRGVNFGFWSHLGCSGQNAIMIIFSREGLV